MSLPAEKIQRYAELVDAKYLGILTSDETVELKKLGDALDKDHQEFYEKIIAELKRLSGS